MSGESRKIADLHRLSGRRNVVKDMDELNRDVWALMTDERGHGGLAVSELWKEKLAMATL